MGLSAFGAHLPHHMQPTRPGKPATTLSERPTVRRFSPTTDMALRCKVQENGNIGKYVHVLIMVLVREHLL